MMMAERVGGLQDGADQRPTNDQRWRACFFLVFFCFSPLKQSTLCAEDKKMVIGGGGGSVVYLLSFEALMLFFLFRSRNVEHTFVRGLMRV